MSNSFTSLVRLGSEPEIRVIPSGKSVLNFSAASTTGFGDKKQTLWLRVTYWNNPEKVASFLAKGDQVVISGELSQRNYEKDGVTKTSLELNATSIDLVGKKQDSEPARQPQPTPQQRAVGGQSQHHQQKSNGYAPNQDNFSDDLNSDIPF